MNKTHSPKISVLLAFGLVIVSLFVFNTSMYTAIMCGTWLILFAWFTLSKRDHETRGFILILGSIFIAVAGKSLLKCTESELHLEMLSQVFLIIGGSVGGNFVAKGMLQDRTNDQDV